MKNMYDEAYKQTEKAAKTPLEIAKGENEYNKLKKTQAASRKIAESNLRDRMASLGLGAPDSTTLQMQSKMAGLGEQGAIARQQERFGAAQDALGRQADIQSQAQLSNVQALTQGAYGASEIDRMNRESQEQYEDENALRNVYYQMFQNRKLTAKQFKALTGIDVKAWPSVKKAQPSSGPSDFFSDTHIPSAYMTDQISRGTSAQDAAKSLSKQVDDINDAWNQGKISTEEAVRAYYNITGAR